jgi:hypothetical protein
MKTESTWVSTDRWWGGAWSRAEAPPDAHRAGLHHPQHLLVRGTPPTPPPLRISRGHFLRPVWNKRLGWYKSERHPFYSNRPIPDRTGYLRARKGDFRRGNGVIHSHPELTRYAGGRGPRVAQPKGERRPHSIGYCLLRPDLPLRVCKDNRGS